MDEFTEVEEQGWFSRITESIKSVAGGGALFLIAFPLLFTNEGCAVKTAKSLEAGAAAVVSVMTNDKVDAANEGKLVHMTGKAVASAPLIDPELKVGEPALKLSRTVEMFQWVEKKKTTSKKKAGGKKVKKTTYSYSKKWSDKFHDTESFKKKKGHWNPETMPMESDEWHATDVKFGAYDLPKMLTSKIHKYEQYPVTSEAIAKLPKSMKKRAKIANGGIYLGVNSAKPSVGDVRITYMVVKSNAPISIVAQQTGSTFAKYQIPDGDALALLEPGTVTAAAMFKSAQEANVMKTWIIRLAGLIMMFSGLMMIFRPLVIVADVIPFVGSMLDFGLGLFCGVVAFGLSFTTISIAWVFYRPLIGIPMLVLGVGALVGLFIMSKKRKANRPAGTAVPA